MSAYTFTPYVNGEPVDPTASGGTVDKLQLFLEPARTGTPYAEYTSSAKTEVDDVPVFTFTVPSNVAGRYYPRILWTPQTAAAQQTVDPPDPVHFPSDPVPRRILATTSQVSVPWCSASDIASSTRVTGIDQAILDDACFAASDILFALAGHTYPGLAEITVRPAVEYAGGSSWGTTGTGPDAAGGGVVNTAGWNPVLAGGLPGVGSFDGRGLTHIPLGVEPVQYVTQVLIGGALVDPTLYRVDERRWLVRVDGQAWPWVRPDAPLGAFDVTLVYGQPPPRAGVRAAMELAIELAQVYAGNMTCLLAGRVQTINRQGVELTLADPLTLAEHGLIGLPVIDDFLISVRGVKPAPLAPMISAPGMARARRLA